MTIKETFNFIMEFKPMEMPQGDAIYDLEDMDRGRRQGYNEALNLIQEVIKREQGTNLN